MSEPDPRPHLVIATWFYDEQPGFLDFKYRIAALSRHYRVTLVLRHARFIIEFSDLQLDICVLEAPRTGKLALLRYCQRLACWLRGSEASAVVLLGSQLALTRFMLPERLPCLLYWNEHPTHFFGASGGLKARFAALLVQASFRAAARCAAVMPIGGALRDDLLAQGVSASTVHLIPMGVSDRFESVVPTCAGLEPLRLVYTGTIAVDRGRDVMLEGLALARKQGLPVHLTLVGAAPEALAYCHARAEALGIADALQLVGRVPGSEIPRHLAQAHLGVCLWADKPWWRFNPPTKLFEYLVAGLPLLVSNIRTHTDYVQQGVNGWVFDYSPEGFAEGIAAVWARRQEVPTWAQQARAGAQAYRWAAIEPLFVQLVAQFARRTA